MKNLVEIKNNQVVVSSRQVAEKFGKQHKDVLENIRNILVAENSATKFYQESIHEYRGQRFPEYLMNRDGFTLLAMGFTGKDALQWKMKYIAAFNEMEQALNSKPVSTLKAREVEARLNNSRARVASTFLKVAQMTDLPEYKHICQQKAAEVLSGLPLLPMEEAKEITYSATDIGKMLGVSANKIGKIANQHNLKTPQYGKLFYSKSEHSCKEVETFRYYECAILKFREILKGGVVA
ncbi:phage regulatory protein [Phascolarctobacterium faecium]|jgi:Rha family phage regulatory protein|uniref:Phage regulatory protein n=1 Tax=Phascolarctobacterium faecium TaxID=33025 RepID=A0A7X2XHL6_9FIRM|nr:Rha family transcriptional regulator [Phascolarctobacterium faecium]KAA3380307.1 Rha family transcriptional regulator [Akkermansia muciniphila]MTS81979.1 phage regulatory protein [Phascolarctobacterium faecium]MTT03361.1 phage regulatory protein [Phascolarctobacterium faecium]MTT17290.1 phage regulatory protein [Phascolarctobacterium faecium]MTT35386.1 phage regulatory protein [Phascolarctobacterium faecium]